MTLLATITSMPLVTRGFLAPTPRHHGVAPLSQAMESCQEPKRRHGWRRAFRKVRRPKRSDRKDSVGAPGHGKVSTAMQMTSVNDVMEDQHQTTMQTKMSSMLADFERLSPSDVFANLTIDEIAIAKPNSNAHGGGTSMHTIHELFIEEGSSPEVLMEYEDELLLNLLSSPSTMPTKADNRKAEKSTTLNGIESASTCESTSTCDFKVDRDRAAVVKTASKNWAENQLLELFQRRSVEPPQDLTVTVDPKGNVITRLLRGKFKADVEVFFRKLVFQPIQLSSGSIQAKRLILNLWSFTPDLLRKGTIRYPSQFDFYFSDCVFSEQDLIQSRSIRNGLQGLLVRVLTRAGVPSNQVLVKSIQLLVRSFIQFQCILYWSILILNLKLCI